jgi:hypothetical protein
MEVVRTWMMDDAEVVVDGDPAMVFSTDSFGEDEEDEGEGGKSETNVMDGKVVFWRVCETGRQRVHYDST